MRKTRAIGHRRGQKAKTRAKTHQGRKGYRRERLTEAHAFEGLRFIDVALRGRQVVVPRGPLNLERLVSC